MFPGLEKIQDAQVKAENMGDKKFSLWNKKFPASVTTQGLVGNATQKKAVWRLTNIHGEKNGKEDTTYRRQVPHILHLLVKTRNLMKLVTLCSLSRWENQTAGFRAHLLPPTPKAANQVRNYQSHQEHRLVLPIYF